MGGFLATDKSYENFRMNYSNRLLGGGHAQNMLLWCARNATGGYPNNACGGIQYQPPGRSMWDYRVGQNKSPGGKNDVGDSQRTAARAQVLDGPLAANLVRRDLGDGRRSF